MNTEIKLATIAIIGLLVMWAVFGEKEVKREPITDTEVEQAYAEAIQAEAVRLANRTEEEKLTDALEAIEELQLQNNELESQNNELESRIEDIEIKLNM